MRKVVGPIKAFRGAIKEARYEMISPLVQQYGDVALLTFNLINYGRVPKGQKPYSPGGTPRKSIAE